MKIRISCKNGETSAEYSRVDEFHKLRKTILKFLLFNTEARKIIYVNTNNGIKTSNREEMEKVLEKTGNEYSIEEINVVEQKFLGFAMPFRRRKKEQAKRAFLITALVDKETDADLIYDGFLCKFDYALCAQESENLGDVHALLRRGAENILFNKQIFMSTFYDSIVVRRMRVDIIDRKLEEELKSIRKMEG